MKKMMLAVLLALSSVALTPAYAGTVDLLSIWSADKNKSSGGVDEDGNGTLDQKFAKNCVTCVVTSGSIAGITSAAFWSTGTAQDKPEDTANMLTFEGVNTAGLTGTKYESGFKNKTLKTTPDFVGYITVKASTFVWLFEVKDDGIQGNQIAIEIGRALDNKYHNISHYTEWTVAEVPVPAAAWLFFSGLMGLFGLRRSVKK